MIIDNLKIHEESSGKTEFMESIYFYSPNLLLGENIIPLQPLSEMAFDNSS